MLNVDFLRRATPPRLREQGLPADKRLRLYARESIIDDGQGGSRWAVDIYLNNPVTNGLEGSLRHRHAPLQYSNKLLVAATPPVPANDTATFVFPLGYYPVASLRRPLPRRQPIHMEAQIIRAGQHTEWRLDLRNALERPLCDIYLSILYPEQVRAYNHILDRSNDFTDPDISLLVKERLPNNLNHHVTNRPASGSLEWRAARLAPDEIISCILQIEVSSPVPNGGANDGIPPLPLVPRFRGTASLDATPLEYSFQHVRYDRQPLAAQLQCVSWVELLGSHPGSARIGKDIEIVRGPGD